jgi:Contractile injection system tube protein
MSAQPVRAKFTPLTGTDLKPIDVQFNPVSLQYSASNTLTEDSSDKKKKQWLTKVTGKLTMELVFDNTDDGQDVRVKTKKIAYLMAPPADEQDSADKKQVAIIVLFEWGKYTFKGMMESYSETLDYFAPEGVPLRATVSVGLVEQPVTFTPGSAEVSGALTPDAVDVPNGAGNHATALATLGGDPNGGRALAGLNGQATMRFSAGSSMTVSGSIPLGPPAGFTSGGASIGIGAGAGFGIGASAGIGMGASAGAGVASGATVGTSFGGSASGGVSASEGAFAGLHAGVRVNSLPLNINRFLQVSDSASISTDSSATFQVGGQAISQESAGLRADVGSSADLRSRIQFEVN